MGKKNKSIKKDEPFSQMSIIEYFTKVSRDSYKLF